MPTNTRRKFLTAAVPAFALSAAAAEGQTASPPQPQGKRVYRKTSSTSITLQSQPLYSPELSFGNLVFVSGKGAGTNFPGDIKAHTTRVLELIEESLKIAGSSMDKVLKVGVFLTDMKNFGGMNEVYVNRFGPEPPVRTTVEVSALPDGSLVEIDCIAYKN